MTRSPFSVGEIVWAQYKNNPFWPGRIVTEEMTSQLVEHTGKDGVGVLFLGTPLSYALIPHEKVVDFKPNLERFCNGSDSEEFKAALEMATTSKKCDEAPLIIFHRRTLQDVIKANVTEENEA